MDCLRSLFSCCCVSEDPVSKFFPFEQALSPANDHAATDAKVHNLTGLLTIIADYAVEGIVTVDLLNDISLATSPLQKLLIERRTILELTEIPPQHECVALARRTSCITQLRLAGGAKETSIPHLLPFNALQFISITDYDFYLKDIPLLAQFPNLVGIDITPIGEPLDQTDMRDQMQLTQLAKNTHMIDVIVPLFTRMAALTYVHIRNGVHVRLDTLNNLPQACQDYVATELALVTPTPRPNRTELLLLSDEVANKRFSAIRRSPITVQTV